MNSLLKGLWISCIYFLVTIELNSLSASSAELSKCKTKETCGSCIQTPGCAWCSEIGFANVKSGNNIYRCNEIEEYNTPSNSCRPNDIQIPPASRATREERTNQADSDTVTIKPGKWKVSGRVGDKVNVTMEFNDLPMKPLDLYYLLDSSCTMAQLIDEVKTSTRTLESNLKKITSDLKLGLGGFVDKPIMPFISDPEDVNRGGCQGKSSVGPYGFRNYLKLSTSTEFLRSITAHQTSYNRDNPEGGLDALMQAVVCDSTIGWREDSVRLIVLATDAEFHIAGDAKLAGIIIPHDGNCYMTPKTGSDGTKFDEYTHATRLDYPSIALLNKKIKEKKVRVIFAVRHYAPLYQDLSALIEGSAVTELRLNNNNKFSIENIILEEFEKLTSKIELQTFPSDDYIGITYFALCPGAKDFERDGKCLKRNNLMGPRNITFKIEIEFKKCPPRSPTSREIEIQLIGVTQKKLVIELNPECQCDCAKSAEQPSSTPSGTDTEATSCQNGGTFNCGICECPRHYCGARCDKRTEDTPDRKLCRSNNVECSGQGSCNCGKCECNPGYDGQYCEYDTSKCPTSNGLICSGRSQGVCRFNNTDGIQSSVCQCLQGFTGSKCECPAETRGCIINEKVCSGPDRGKCECNECKCLDGYAGRHCEACLYKENHPTLLLQTFKDCLQCHTAETGKDSAKKCDPKCSNAVVTRIEQIDSGCDGKSKPCGIEYFESSSSCQYNFTYECTPKDKNILTVKLNRNGRCPGPANLFGIFVAVGGAILLIGILTLLIWRLATFVYDRREYERFKKETQDASWNREENPLFVPTTKNFVNPIHNTAN